MLLTLKEEEAPLCVSCDEPLSLEHTLLFCSDLIDIREKYFNVDSLKEISSDVVFNCQKQINLK